LSPDGSFGPAFQKEDSWLHSLDFMNHPSEKVGKERRQQMEFFFQPLAFAIPGFLPLLPPNWVESGLVHPAGKVFMTRNQALRRAFPQAHLVWEMRQLLTKKERFWLQKQLGRSLPERGYLAWLAFDSKGRYLGMSLLTTELGKTEPFFLMVSLDPQARILHVDVLEYREPRGAEVRRRSYLRRYEGLGEKNLQKALRRIPVIPGATLSSHAVSRAVQKTLALHRLYLQEGTPIHGKIPSALARLKLRFQRAKAKRRRLPSPPKKKPGNKERVSLSLPSMGDLFFAEFGGLITPEDFRVLTAQLVELEARWSPHVPHSLPACFNRLPQGGSLSIKAAETTLLNRALRASHRSEGAFSPIRDTHLPDRVLGLTPGRLHRLGPGKLDPGGFLKGWACDLLRQEAENRGLNVLAIGFRSSLFLSGIGALATSGLSRRGSHIRDPRSGIAIHRSPTAQSWASCALDAEFRSTSAFVLHHRKTYQGLFADPKALPEEDA
jgi:Na+-translocating ferredoxin:NAD+ oxidoreductase RnfG subunit